MVITSFDNNTIKRIARLADKKYRDETGEYVIEGYRAVKDSLPYLDSAKLVFSQTAYGLYADEFAGVDAIVWFGRGFRQTFANRKFSRSRCRR